MRSLTRRELLKLGALGGAAAALPAGGAAAAAAGLFVVEDHQDSPHVPSFTVPLRIPTELTPTRSTATTDYYTLRQRPADVEILPGFRPTRVWGYAGQVPGPTITQHKGRNVVVTQVNELGVPTTTHLHGGDVPPGSDGHPLDLVAPGASKSHDYPGLHPAANLWYHDHAVHATGRNIWMGLAGFYRVTDDAERRLPLPKVPYDIPLIVCDRFFLRDGSLAYPIDGDEPERQGAFGDVVLVNGRPKPYFGVETRRYLFRLVNASNARVYRFSLSTGEPFQVVSTEGGYLEHPVTTSSVVMAPSERLGIVVDFSRYAEGTKIVLRNTYDTPGDPFDPAKTRDVMRFEVTTRVADPSSVPQDLVAPSLVIDPKQAVVTRTWEFERSGGQWVINDRPWSATRIDARPKLGTVEIWKFVNSSGGWVHPIHPHLVEYLILDRTRRPVQPWERGPKDTTFLGPNEEARVAIRWESHRGVYAFHCHNAEHEDHDMMSQFEVV